MLSKYNSLQMSTTKCLRFNIVDFFIAGEAATVHLVKLNYGNALLFMHIRFGLFFSR